MSDENGRFGGRDVVIVEAARLPVGRGHEEKGYYKDVHASTLLAKTYAELIDRAGIDASEVEDVVAGTSIGSPASSQALRPMFIPCSPNCCTQPQITSPTSFGSIPARLISSE